MIVQNTDLAHTGLLHWDSLLSQEHKMGNSLLPVSLGHYLSTGRLEPGLVVSIVEVRTSATGKCCE